MESSNTELSRTTSSPVKHDQHDSTAPPADEKAAPEKISSPSSSRKSFSLDSSLDDHSFHNDDCDDDDDDDKSTSSTASSPSHEPDKIPVSENSVPSSEPSDSSRVNEAAATEAPPNQEMERSPSAYRIPSSVFERSQSSTPMEWSVASNESLFSIYTGNMSFTNDQFYWRSGELVPTAEASTSDQMFSYSAQDSAGGAAADMRSRELGIAEATMLEVIKESEGQNHVNVASLAEVRKARRSEGSNTSNKSFAFSVMGGETGSSVRMPSSVRSNQEQAEQSQSQSQSQSLPMAKPEPPLDPKMPAETGNGAQSKWFSCFSCCSFCN